MAVRNETMVGQAYDEIRSAILHGRFAPGTKIVVHPIAEELGLSPTPIKVALSALAREGIVEAIPRRGFFVPTFGRDDIRDICILRTALDQLAAGLAAAQEDRTDMVDSLESSIARQKEALRDGDLPLYADLNTEFHRAIWEGSRNGRLVSAADNILGQVRLLVSTSAGLPGRPDQSVHEHAEIARALSEGNAEVAVRLVVDHACNSERALLQRLGFDDDEPDSLDVHPNI